MNLLLKLVVAYYLFQGFSAYAGIMADGTRVIYQEGAREKSLMIANTNSYPVIVQTWVDNGDGSPPDEPAFVTVPSILRMAPGSIHGIRFIPTGSTLPKDRESSFWVNLYELPPLSNSGDHQTILTLAMNTQIKFFYRPKHLKPRADNIAEALTIRVENNGSTQSVVLSNSSQYHISISGIYADSTKEIAAVNFQSDMMIRPYGAKAFLLLPNKSTKLDTVYVNYINDSGFEDSVALHIKKP